MSSATAAAAVDDTVHISDSDPDYDNDFALSDIEPVPEDEDHKDDEDDEEDNSASGPDQPESTSSSDSDCEEDEDSDDSSEHASSSDAESNEAPAPAASASAAAAASSNPGKKKAGLDKNQYIACGICHERLSEHLSKQCSMCSCAFHIRCINTCDRTDLVRDDDDGPLECAQFKVARNDLCTKAPLTCEPLSRAKQEKKKKQEDIQFGHEAAQSSDDEDEKIMKPKQADTTAENTKMRMAKLSMSPAILVQVFAPSDVSDSAAAASAVEVEEKDEAVFSMGFYLDPTPPMHNGKQIFPAPYRSRFVPNGNEEKKIVTKKEEYGCVVTVVVDKKFAKWYSDQLEKTKQELENGEPLSFNDPGIEGRSKADLEQRLGDIETERQATTAQMTALETPDQGSDTNVEKKYKSLVSKLAKLAKEETAISLWLTGEKPEPCIELVNSKLKKLYAARDALDEEFENVESVKLIYGCEQELPAIEWSDEYCNQQAFYESAEYKHNQKEYKRIAEENAKRTSMIEQDIERQRKLEQIEIKRDKIGRQIDVLEDQIRRLEGRELSEDEVENPADDLPLPGEFQGDAKVTGLPPLNGMKYLEKTQQVAAFLHTMEGLGYVSKCELEELSNEVSGLSLKEFTGIQAVFAEIDALLYAQSKKCFPKKMQKLLDKVKYVDSSESTFAEALAGIEEKFPLTHGHISHYLAVPERIVEAERQWAEEKEEEEEEEEVVATPAVKSKKKVSYHGDVAAASAAAAQAVPMEIESDADESAPIASPATAAAYVAKSHTSAASAASAAATTPRASASSAAAALPLSGKKRKASIELESSDSDSSDDEDLEKFKRSLKDLCPPPPSSNASPTTAPSLQHVPIRKAIAAAPMAAAAAAAQRNRALDDIAQIAKAVKRDGSKDDPIPLDED